ncbi:MAG: hypothetical protein Fur0023_01890 [Bacteroidia bacterium]
MRLTDFIYNHTRPLHWKIIFFIVSCLYSLSESFGRSDFTIYQLASLDVVNNINPYSHSYIDGYYYYYSLLFAYAIYPFTFLNAYASIFLWLVFNSVLLYFILIKIADFSGIFRQPTTKQFLFFILLILFGMRVIRENYHSAQVTILLLFLMIYSVHFLTKEKYIISSLLLSLAINIKLLALPMLVYYLYRGYWKTFILTILWTIILFVIPVIWMPLNFYTDCIREWWLLINPSNDHHLIDTEERSFHGITTLISTLFLKNPPDIYALPIRRHIVDLSVEQVKTIIQITRVILILSVLIVIKKRPFVKPSISELCYEIAYVMALIPLIFPHQQHYAFLFQLPAISILIYFYLTASLSLSQKIILWIIFLCFNLKIILGAFNEYYDHFKILTYGGLMVIGMMIYISFLKLRNKI